MTATQAPADPYWRVVRVEPDWEEFAGPGWLDRIMAEEVTDRFHAKQGRSIARWTLTAPDGRRLVAYLKRHYELPRWRGLLAAVLPGRAWSPGLGEWEHLAWARANGLPVPRAMAVGEWVGSWGRLRGFLAVEELPEMLPLHEAIPLALSRLSPDDFARWKRGLVAELARLARQLHDRWAFHQDLYLCHFYVPDADTARVPGEWPGRVWMIDFHRLTRRRVGWRWWQVKDLAHCCSRRSASRGSPTATAHRFWKLYRANDPTWVKGAVRWKARRYDRHNNRK